MAFGQWTSIFVWTLGDHSADGSTLLCLLSGNLSGPFAGHVFVCLDLSNLLNAFLGLFWTTRAWACIFLHVLGHISSYGLFNVEPVALPLYAQLVPVVAAQCGQPVPVHVVL